jgi:DNA-binding NtrC family response regulator
MPAARIPAEALARTPAPLRSGARRVLVIDDEEQVLLAMQQLLQVWGHHVWCASSADEAVVLAIEHAQDIDMLISDYRLGGNTTAVHAISAVHACLPSPVPTYILTGDTSPQRIHEASVLGFPILHKPVDPAALWQALEREDGHHARPLPIPPGVAPGQAPGQAGMIAPLPTDRLP